MSSSKNLGVLAGVRQLLKHALVVHVALGLMRLVSTALPVVGVAASLMGAVGDDGVAAIDGIPHDVKADCGITTVICEAVVSGVVCNERCFA